MKEKQNIVAIMDNEVDNNFMGKEVSGCELTFVLKTKLPFKLSQLRVFYN